jgi:hypothetical protein
MTVSVNILPDPIPSNLIPVTKPENAGIENPHATGRETGSFGERIEPNGEMKEN